jgi:predicted Zn-dependent peptidase
MQFNQATLNNGLNVIAEVNPRAYSMAVAFYVRTGSRDETPEVSGVSHFLEHMAFKGNADFSADDVNRVFDEVGARYNASTSEEVTLFYAAVLPEYVERTFELLSMLLYPSLRRDDFDMEKQVILEEIGMYDDLPHFVAYEQVMGAHFAEHPLGRSILGTTDSITALTAEQMRAYHDQRYTAPNITLVAAGNTDWDLLLDLANRHCGGWPTGNGRRDTAEAHPAGRSFCVHRPAVGQQHVMQLAPAPAAASELRFAAELLSVIVGDDSGSRLYWELVDPGDVDAAELSYNDYDGSGAWSTYLCCRPEQARENLQRIARIYDDVNRDGVTDDELEQARNKLASRVVLSSERPIGRLASLGSNWVYRKEYRTVEDDVTAIQQVTRDDIAGLLEKYPLAQTTTAGVGPLESL